MELEASGGGVGARLDEDELPVRIHEQQPGMEHHHAARELCDDILALCGQRLEHRDLRLGRQFSRRSGMVALVVRLGHEVRPKPIARIRPALP